MHVSCLSLSKSLSSPLFSASAQHRSHLSAQEDLSQPLSEHNISLLAAADRSSHQFTTPYSTPIFSCIFVANFNSAEFPFLLNADQKEANMSTAVALKVCEDCLVGDFLPQGEVCTPFYVHLITTSKKFIWHCGIGKEQANRDVTERCMKLMSKNVKELEVHGRGRKRIFTSIPQHNSKRIRCYRLKSLQYIVNTHNQELTKALKLQEEAKQKNKPSPSKATRIQIQTPAAPSAANVSRKRKHLPLLDSPKAGKPLPPKRARIDLQQDEQPEPIMDCCEEPQPIVQTVQTFPIMQGFLKKRKLPKNLTSPEDLLPAKRAKIQLAAPKQCSPSVPRKKAAAAPKKLPQVQAHKKVAAPATQLKVAIFSKECQRFKAQALLEKKERKKKSTQTLQAPITSEIPPPRPAETASPSYTPITKKRMTLFENLPQVQHHTADGPDAASQLASWTPAPACTSSGSARPQRPLNFLSEISEDEDDQEVASFQQTPTASFEVRTVPGNPRADQNSFASPVNLSTKKRTSADSLISQISPKHLLGSFWAPSSASTPRMPSPSY